MPLIGAATALYKGTTPITAVYAGAVKVWPPAPTSLFFDDFTRVAASTATMGNGWNGTNNSMTMDGADCLYRSGGYGRLITTGQITLPLDYSVEVVATRATWSSSWNGIVGRYHTDTTGVRLFTQNGSAWIIGSTDGYNSQDGAITVTSGFPAGWTAAGDHTLRLTLTGTRADVYADGQHVGYRSGMGTWCNSTRTGTGIGFCGDSASNPRPFHSIRALSI
jgi:hypothetical protein